MYISIYKLIRTWILRRLLCILKELEFPKFYSRPLWRLGRRQVLWGAYWDVWVAPGAPRELLAGAIITANTTDHHYSTLFSFSCGNHYIVQDKCDLHFVQLVRWWSATLMLTTLFSSLQFDAVANEQRCSYLTMWHATPVKWRNTSTVTQYHCTDAIQSIPYCPKPQ